MALRAPLQTFGVLSSMETRQNPGAAILRSVVHVVKSLSLPGKREKKRTLSLHRERGGEAASVCGGGRSGSLFQMRRQRSEDDQGTYQETHLCSSTALTGWLMELHQCAPLLRLSLLFFQGFGLRSALSKDYHN